MLRTNLTFDFEDRECALEMPPCALEVALDMKQSR
jgi:hypothetical protein